MFRLDPYRELDRLFQTFTGESATVFAPVDAYRVDDNYVVEFDLPGVDPSSIDVTVERNVLSVKAERKLNRANGSDVVLAERFAGSYHRSIYLGSELDSERVQASYSDGVLRLVIPIADAAKPRKISVSHEGNAKELTHSSK
jgi:HSP20 family protein